MIPIVLYFDGCVEPTNPGGWMSGAWVALARDGSEVAHDSFVCPPTPANTNNQAEYLALIAGLTWLRDQRISGIRVRGDSQLVIQQVRGHWAVRAPVLIPLHAEATELVRATGVQLEWVRREMNRRADGYSRRALPPEARR